MRIARPAEAGHGPNLVDAGATGRAGVLAAAVGVDKEAQRGLGQRQGLFQGLQHEFNRHMRGWVPAHDTARTGVPLGGQLAPEPFH